MQEDGNERRKVVADPILEFIAVSPDGQWVLAWAGVPDQEVPNAAVAFPVQGGTPIPVCSGRVALVALQDGIAMANSSTSLHPPRWAVIGTVGVHLASHCRPANLSRLFRLGESSRPPISQRCRA